MLAFFNVAEGEFEDYHSFSNIRVTISSGSDAGRTVTTPVIIVNNFNFEPTEYFTVSIIPDPIERIYTIEGQGTATAFILDDDSELLVHDKSFMINYTVFLGLIFGFDQVQYSVREDTPSVAITISRMNGMLGGNVTEVTVILATEDGTAACKSEY